MRIRNGVLGLAALFFGCHRSAGDGPSKASSSAIAVLSTPPPKTVAPTSSAPIRSAAPLAHLDPERAVLERVMSCFSADEPSVCPWWESVVDKDAHAKAAAACDTGNSLACLTAGLASVGARSFADAASRIEKACATDEPLGCVYLAAAHFTCIHVTEAHRATCMPAFESHYDDVHAEKVLTEGCEGGLAAACSALGEVVWRREDNRFPWLERACRFGVMDACETLFSEAQDIAMPPNPRHLGWVRIRIMEICDEQAVDCFSAAGDLGDFTHTPSHRFIDRACDPKTTPHMPKPLCEAARHDGQKSAATPHPGARLR